MNKTKRLGCFMLMVFFFFSAVRTSSAAVAWGSRGEQVRAVQEKLRQYGYMTSSADGVFGQETYNAVIRFQKRRLKKRIIRYPKLSRNWISESR